MKNPALKVIKQTGMHKESACESFLAFLIYFLKNSRNVTI